MQAKNMAAYCLWSIMHGLILPVPNTFHLHVLFCFFVVFFPDFVGFLISSRSPKRC